MSISGPPPRSRSLDTGSNSLRIDIPKNDVPEENQRRDGVDFFDGDDERFSDRRPADKLLSEIFASPANRFRHKMKNHSARTRGKPTKIRNVSLQRPYWS